MKLGIFLLMFSCFKSSQTKKLYGMEVGKGPYNQNTYDGCPEDAMRCDDKCIFESDHWNTPCLVRAPWAPCVQFQYPFYCPALKTCLSVLDQCEGKCVEQEAYINPYSDYPESYICGDKCANIYVPCNGSCAHPPEIKKYDYNLWELDYACGEMCLGEPTAKKAKICDGKCMKASGTCNGVEEKIEGIEEEKEKKEEKYCYGMNDCTTCDPGYDFACKDGKKCMPESRVCDGGNDCNDGSDEESCACINMANNCTICSEHLGEGGAYQCKNEKKCIASHNICNGNLDCLGGDDEACIDDNGNYCEGGMRQCEDKWLCNKVICDGEEDERCEWPFYECNSKCINRKESCDGKCRDEYQHFCNGKCLDLHEQCNGVCANSDYIGCTNSTECIRSWDGCNEEKDCDDGSDEWTENCKCPGMWKCEKCFDLNKSFACKDNKKCINYMELCNGIQDCEDNSDEADCELDGECPGMYFCWSSPETYICKNELCRATNGDFCFEQKCGDKCISKESTCEKQCLDREGKKQRDREYCPATNTCITKEESCGGTCLTKNYFPCGDKCIQPWYSSWWECNGVCISQTNPCNGTCAPQKIKCGDGCIDEYERKWDCNGVCIDEEQSCNGECNPDGDYTVPCGKHCIYDESEGKICNGECMTNTELRRNYKGNSKWNPLCGNECPFGFKCKDGSACLELGSECDGVKDCPDGSDEDAGFCKECHKYASGSSSQNEKVDYHCLTEPSSYGHCSDSQNYYLCGDKCIYKSEFCQETNSCNRDDFHCGDDTCIEKDLRCNEVSDCKTGLDEKDCPDCSERHGVWFCGKTLQCRDTPCGGGSWNGK